ncbi:unnamed protein product [Amoebophrya sp. A120]|nr:unnamed protein product [Amoebophrya sp. A120]|eukprot:GSA120T00006725001.1
MMRNRSVLRRRSKIQLVFLLFAHDGRWFSRMCFAAERTANPKTEVARRSSSSKESYTDYVAGLEDHQKFDVELLRRRSQSDHKDLLLPRNSDEDPEAGRRDSRSTSSPTDIQTIPTEYQAASLAKQLLGQQGFATMMVRYYRDPQYQDFPFGQVEQIAADCANQQDIWIFSSPLEATLDAVLHYKNHVSFHVRAPNANDTAIDPMTLHSVTFLGRAKPGARFGADSPAERREYQRVSDCFFAKHPDARQWEHMTSHNFTFWTTSVEKIHYVGGFGDTHYIGDISPDLFAKAPATPYCEDWPGSPKTKEKCCPYDSDNAMRSCCRKTPPVLNGAEVEQPVGTEPNPSRGAQSEKMLAGNIDSSYKQGKAENPAPSLLRPGVSEAAFQDEIIL